MSISADLLSRYAWSNALVWLRPDMENIRWGRSITEFV